MACLATICPLSAAATSATDAPATGATTAFAALPAAARTLVDGLIAANLVFEPELDAQEVRTAFAALIAETKAALPAGRAPRDVIPVLNRTILTQKSVRYLSNLY